MERDYIQEVVDLFYQTDLEEAYIINEHFDNAADKTLPTPARLQDAISTTEAELGDLYLHANSQEVGFETAKRAHRWREYKKAYTFNLKASYEQLDTIAISHAEQAYEAANSEGIWPTEAERRKIEARESFYKQSGLAPSYSSYTDKYNQYLSEQEEAAKYIADGDLTYISLYAALEKQRAQKYKRNKDGSLELDDILFDPFKFEEETAVKGLANAMDDRLKHAGQFTSDTFQSTEGIIFNGSEPYKYGLSSILIDRGTCYALNLTDAVNPYKDPRGEIVPDYTYYIDDAPGGFHYEADSPHSKPLFDTAIAVDLARRLFVDKRKQNFERDIAAESASRTPKQS